MGDFLAKKTKLLLKKWKNKEINEEEFVFRRVHKEIFISQRPDHRLKTTQSMFRNEKGDGMSVDWEKICSDPHTTQTRNVNPPENYGVVVLSVFDMQSHPKYKLEIINDQIGYDCHCLVKGIPMSLKNFQIFKRNDYDLLSEEDRNLYASKLLDIREHLRENAFWIIPINNPDIPDPPLGFDYYEEFTESIKNFFKSRGHSIPT